MKVLGIAGSKRKNGNTENLVRCALDAIRSDDIETELICLGEYRIEGCTGCEGCRNTYKCVIGDDMQNYIPACWRRMLSYWGLRRIFITSHLI